MTDNHMPVNPLFAAPAPSRRAAQNAAKLGGYGGMAVAAWLVTAVATGYGLGGADTTGPSSGSSSSTSSSTSTSESTGSATTTAGTATSTTTGSGSTSSNGSTSTG